MHTMKRIQCLPELCLLNIFDRIPLHDLTHIGQVCPRWYSLEKSALARRHHLSLFVCSENPKPEFNRERIHLKCFKNSTTQKVIELFPNVNSLTIEHEDADDDDEDDDEEEDDDGEDDDGEDDFGSLKPLALTNLLTHEWSSKLISFDLIKTRDIFYESSKSLPIIKAINSLPSLKRLSLLDAIFYRDIKPQFRILAQLEQFYCRSSDNLDLIDWCVKYAQGNTTLRRIEIDTRWCVELESVLKLSPELALKFTSLYSNNERFLDVNNRLFAQFCSYFSSLHRIRIRPYSDNFTKRLACVSTSLKQLKTLGLGFYDTDYIENMSDQLEIVPLQSVNKLTLSMFGSQDETLKYIKSINFGHLFPKLEFVSIDCEFDFVDDDDDDGPIEYIERTKEQEQEHYESMIKPLMKCEYLREIEYKSGDFETKFTRNSEI